MSKQSSFDKIKKLRLRRGDCLVVREFELAQQISKMKFPFLNFQVPIICAPLGVEVIPADELVKVAERARATSQLIIPGKI